MGEADSTDSVKLEHDDLTSLMDSLDVLYARARAEHRGLDALTLVAARDAVEMLSRARAHANGRPMTAPSIYDNLNPDWEEDQPVLPGWEPWEPDEDVDTREGGCDYCGAPDVRENPEPFGGKPCCDACFNVIIGGEPDDPPWRCETEGSAR